jgi:hypothetical protein
LKEQASACCVEVFTKPEISKHGTGAQISVFILRILAIVLYQLRSALPLNQPLCEQLLGSICAPLVFFLGVAEKLREILVILLLGITYVLVVSLSTLQRIIENTDKVVGYICRTGVPG